MPELLDQLASVARADAYWIEQIQECTAPRPCRKSIHLAVFVEPFLSLLMCGQKTIESRFSANGCAPFEQIWPGDLVLLKRAGGEIVGIGRVRDARHLRRPIGGWDELRLAYQHQIGAPDNAFWSDVSAASYATLIWFDHIDPIAPLECDKRDRRGWVVVKRASEQLPLQFA